MVFFYSPTTYHRHTHPPTHTHPHRTDIMYINIYGCDKYGSGVYYVKSSYKDEQTGLDIPGAFDGNPYFSSWDEVPNYFRCNDFAEGPRSI